MVDAQPDELFYFSTVTFRAENSLFKVPRLYFEKNSSAFRDMFSLPETDTQEGSSDANPIELQSINKVDFQRLMTAMFPDLSRFTSKPVLMGCEEWTSVLKLSTLWRFGELRREAIDELSHILVDAVDKVTLARAYNVEHWLVEGYAELVKRDDGLSPAEHAKLGSDTTIQLYREREKTFKNAQIRSNSGHRNSHPRAFHDVEQNIRQSFQAELENIRYDEIVIAEETASDTNPQRRKRAIAPYLYDPGDDWL